MNLCFFIGEIASDIEFKFILNSKNISIAYFDIELRDKTVITVKCYNEIADYCYSKLKKEKTIFIRRF